MNNQQYIPNVTFKYPQWVIPLVMEATQGTSIPPDLLLALLYHESGFNPSAVSSAGAQGIAQFMPGTAQEYGIDPLNKEQAINAAAQYLQKYYDIYKNWEDTLAAYNAGPGNVPHWRQIAETAKYVPSILGSIRGNLTPTSTGHIPRESPVRGGSMVGVNLSSRKSHTVRPGDTLWGIAQQYLGSGSKWGELKGYSGDPTKLPVGTTIYYG